MPKLNTKSRLELAHLKRQLEIRRKLVKPLQKDVVEPMSSSIEKPANENSRFDYKFVFTNTAMKKEDRMFRIQNPAVTIERDMKIIKPLVPTNSFLPYGVTIRNPHMFEEDQLSIIQRRQEVHNITYPTAPYNPFMTVKRDKPKLKTGNASGGHSTSKPKTNSQQSKMEKDSNLPHIPNRYNSKHRGIINKSHSRPRRAQKPLLGYDPKESHMTPIKLTDSQDFNSTRTRDSEFRQQFDALEAHKNSVVDNKSKNGTSDVIDRLSNTVQYLNRYEERLKHYLKSKNTMLHAGAALQKLRFIRSKTVQQLSKLSIPSSQKEKEKEKELAGILKEESTYKKLSFLEEKAKHNSGGAGGFNERRTVGLPKLPQKYLIDKFGHLKSPLNKTRSNVIKKLPPNTGNSQPEKETPREEFKWTPLEVALDGVEPDKISEFIENLKETKKNSEDDRKNVGNSNYANKTKPTVSLYRYQRNPIKILDGNSPILEPPKFSPVFETNQKIEGGSSSFHVKNFGMERGSEVLRRVYNDFHVQEDKIQTELLKEQVRREREQRKSDISSRKLVELNKQLQFKKLLQL